MDLSGKRLLVLGGTISTYDVVKTARKLGAYVLVTDYLETGAAKEIADETAMVSTNDMEGLERLILSKGIDGVFTGASEFNIRNMIQICERMDLPVYITMEQWDICSNKNAFKRLCESQGVPVVREYHLTEELLEEDIEKICYPVIVKPVDSYSGHGISVCRDSGQLKEGYRKALACSNSHEVIVEQYMQGENVELYYIVQDGKVMLSAIADRYTDKNQNGSPIPTAFYHPSRHADLYLSKRNAQVCRMFEKFGLKNGTFFIESFLEEGEFYFYEMGLRLNATMEYCFVDHYNKVNVLEMMITYALTGKMKEESVEHTLDPKFAGAACEIVPILREGTIHRICGMQEILSLQEVIHCIQFYKENEKVRNPGTLDQSFARLHLVGKDRTDLDNTIRKIYSLLRVEDRQGKNMVIQL